MEKMFEGDSFDMSLGAIIANSQIGDEIIFISDERKWTVSEKSPGQLILVSEEIKKGLGCEGCGGNNFKEYIWKNSFLCLDCGTLTVLKEEKVFSKVVINVFVNISLDERLGKKLVRAEEAEAVTEEVA